MAFVGQSLADGQLPSSQAAIFTVPASNRAIVNYIHLHNTGTGPETVTLWLKRSGSTARVFIREPALEADATLFPLEPSEEFTLSAGDTIEAQTTTATTVDYFITGALETI